MDKRPPDALLLNYVNPMAAHCWAVDAAMGRMSGFATAFSKTSEMLSSEAVPQTKRDVRGGRGRRLGKRGIRRSERPEYSRQAAIGP
jgi:hypothetical protein